MELKKKKGNVSEFGIVIITLVTLFIIVMVNITASADYSKKDNISILSRMYILKMETKGYLDQEDEVSLINDLTEVGMKNISLVGTTKSNVGYGKTINLTINGEIEITEYKIKNLFSIDTLKKPIPVEEKRKSTAKH